MFDGGKRLVKRVVGLPSSFKLSDDDYNAYQSFIISTMSRSGWETKNYFEDYVPFLRMLHRSYKCCRTSNSFWRILREKFDHDGMWPVFEQRGETCVVAFFQDRARRTDWYEFKHARDGPGGAAAWSTAPIVHFDADLTAAAESAPEQEADYDDELAC